MCAALFAACAADPEARSDPMPGGPADVSGARAQLDRYRALPVFEPPGPAFDAAAAARGKTVFEIPISSEVPFITAVETGMQQAADLAGARLVRYRNQGDPAQWAQGIQQAIAQRADVITLFAQNPELVAPQITEAERAGIPVVVVRTTGEGQRCQADSAGNTYGTACVPGPFGQAGRLEVDWVVADAAGSANVLVITASDAPSTEALLAGMRDEWRLRCPGCRVRYVDVPIPQWAKRVQAEVAAALVADPGITHIVPIYDSMTQFVKPAVTVAGLDGKIKVATFNGTPFVLEEIQRGDLVRADVGENLGWLGFATMDQVFRVLAGLPPAPTSNTPLRVFDDSNVAEAGTPPRLDAGYGDAYLAGYRKLWGLPG